MDVMHFKSAEERIAFLKGKFSEIVPKEVEQPKPKRKRKKKGDADAVQTE